MVVIVFLIYFQLLIITIMLSIMLGRLMDHKEAAERGDGEAR